MTELVTTMEARAAPLIPEGLRARFKDALDKVAPNRIGVFAGAITAGNRYHSNIHVDQDMFLTYLGVLDGADPTSNAIIHRFVFPRYKVYITLRAGDVLLFNPLEPHGCTEGQVKDPWIFSCYLSARTAVSQQ
jgi:hypothetical protein